VSYNVVKELSGKLVNGLRGTVQTLNKDSVIVQFTSMNSEPHTVQLKPEPFTVFSSLDNKVIATRRQIPICLAFSVTIHKAQGLTLQRVEVDASCIFAPGQLGVAIGRATEKKGLRPIGFNKTSILKHDSSLYQYYNEKYDSKFDTDLSCCRVSFDDITFTNNPNLSMVGDSQLEEDLSDFSDAEIEQINVMLSDDTDITEETEIQVQDKFVDIADISALFVTTDTSTTEQSISSYYQQIIATQMNDAKLFVNNLYSKINEIFEKTCGDVTQKSTEPKTWTKYYSELYQYSISQDYVSLVKSISHCEPSNVHFEMCSKIFDKITSVVLKNTVNI